MTSSAGGATEGERLATGMTDRRDPAAAALMVAAIVAAAIAASAPVWWRFTEPVELLFWHGMASGSSLIIAGYVASRWRSGRRIAKLMFLAAIVYFVPYVGFGRSDLGFTIELLTSGAWMAIGGHFVIAFPEGTLRSRLERVVVLAAYVWTVVGPFFFLPFYDPRDFDCLDCPRNLLLISSEPELAASVVQAIVPVSVTSAVLAVLARRWMRATRPERRVLAPVFGALGANVIAAVALYAAGGMWLAGVITSEAYEAAVIVQRTFVILIPIGVVVGLARSVMARSAVGNLLVRIGEGKTPADLERDVAWALGDPSAGLAYRRGDRSEFLDAAGNPVDLAAAPPSTVTLVEGGGGELAILHDASLGRDQPELLQAVAAATRLALENQQLQTEVKLIQQIPVGLAERLQREGGRVGETRTLRISVLMSDIRGYSSIAERAQLHVLAAQLNEHRAAMNSAVASHGGTIMQFVGDAVFAVFGAPLPLSDHAARAVNAAIQMHAVQGAINDAWSVAGNPPFGLGIAVTTGEVAAALLGSEEHVEYSVVGDVVNLAQRLQAWARPGEIVISEATFADLGGSFEAERLPPGTVKGRATPVNAYRVASPQVAAERV